MKKEHISEFAANCNVTTKTIYNNKKKYGLTFEKKHGATFVLIDKNANTFRDVKNGGLK